MGSGGELKSEVSESAEGRNGRGGVGNRIYHVAPNEI